MCDPLIQIGRFDDISRTCDSWTDLTDGVILSEMIQDMFVRHSTLNENPNFPRHLPLVLSWCWDQI